MATRAGLMILETVESDVVMSGTSYDLDGRRKDVSGVHFSVPAARKWID